MINLENIIWTRHAQEKMRQYGLSEARLRRVLRFPKRREKGIAPKTVALMQPAGSRRRPTEIWLMYQKKGKKLKIITAWRYPGISPVREPPPIPDDILQDLLDK